MKTLILILICFCSVAFGADVAETAAKVRDFIPDASGNALLIGGIVIEFALRFVKTSKPVSIVRSVSKVLRVCAEAIIKAVDFVDAVLPQRVEGQPLIGKKK